MAATNNATRLLNAKGLSFDTHELPQEKLGAIEAAEHLGVAASQVFKSIVFRDLERGDSLLAIIPGHQQADAKALARAAGTSKVKPASQVEAEQLTGLETGGISALALMNKRFRFFVDESALKYQRIYISAGERGLNLSIAPQDFIEFCKIRVAKIAK